jgi:hypothetical protein
MRGKRLFLLLIGIVVLATIGLTWFFSTLATSQQPAPGLFIQSLR